MPFPFALKPLGGKNLLPEGYVKCTAVFFSNPTLKGYCWVDTQLSCTLKCKLKATFSCTLDTSRWQYCGVYEPDKQIQFGVNPTGVGLSIQGNAYYLDNGDRIAVHTFQVDLLNSTAAVDSQVFNIPYNTNISPYTIYLGDRNGSQDYKLTAAANMTLYGFEYTDQAGIRSKMIPCVDPQGKACLYDIYRKRAFYSQGATALEAVL